jgi:hypothetical protein
MAMRKYLGAFLAKPELNKDDIWRHQTVSIAPTIRFLAGDSMSKYFVRRVVNVEKGDPGFYDLVEIYWVDTELEKKYYEFILGPYKEAGLTAPMEAWTKLIIPVWSITEEVLEIVESNDKEDHKLYKTMSSYQILPGTNGNEFWNYLATVHAPDIQQIAGSLIKKYTVHRPVAVAAGDPSSFYAINEIWWASKEARDEFERFAQNYKTASGKILAEDFSSRTAAGAGWVVEIETKQLA